MTTVRWDRAGIAPALDNGGSRASVPALGLADLESSQRELGAEVAIGGIGLTTVPCCQMGLATRASALTRDDARVTGGCSRRGLELCDRRAVHCGSSSACLTGLAGAGVYPAGSITGGCDSDITSPCSRRRHPKVHVGWNIADSQLLAPSCRCPPAGVRELAAVRAPGQPPRSGWPRRAWPGCG